jgi:hypothetical protein
MKNYLTILIFAVMTAALFGQNNLQDVIYLKNGSIIRGTIAEQIPNKSIKITTKDQIVFMYEMNDIDKITKEEIIKDKSGLKSGYRGIFEVGHQIGYENFRNNRLMINIINGYQINPYFSVGIGTGLRYYYDSEDALVPVFLDLRTTFLNKKVSPYIALGAGYSYEPTDNFEGVGYLLNPSIGLNFMISKNSAMNIGLGYEMQRMNIFRRISFEEPGYKKNINIGAISLNTGILF